MTEQVSPLSGKRVLVVEDKYLIAVEVCEQVRDFGCDPLGPFASVDAGVRAADNEQIDCALLDVTLNEEPVFPLAEALRQRHVPMIFLTGYDAEILPPEWRGEPRLQKPVGSRSLHEALLKAMG
jgi:CheY-like chemotaxis protein